MSVTKVDAVGLTRDAFLSLYSKHQLVVVTDALVTWSTAVEAPKQLPLLQQLYKSYSKEIDDTFNIEGDNGEFSSLADALAAKRDKWYCSFIAQNACFKWFATQLPIQEPQVLGLRQDNCLWYFVGSNQSGLGLEGRVEHRDSVGAAGSWHLQLSGSKVWKVRKSAKDNVQEVEVNKGLFFYFIAYCAMFFVLVCLELNFCR